MNCIIVCGAIQDMPWCNIWSADNPADVCINKGQQRSFVYQQRSFVCTTKVICVHKKDKPWFDDQQCLKQEAHLWWTCDHSLVNRDRVCPLPSKS